MDYTLRLKTGATDLLNEELITVLDRLVHSGYVPSVLQMLEEMNDYVLNIEQQVNCVEKEK